MSFGFTSFKPKDSELPKPPDKPLDTGEVQLSAEVTVKVEENLTTRQRILKEYNNIESDIPLNSPYWKS